MMRCLGLAVALAMAGWLPSWGAEPDAIVTVNRGDIGIIQFPIENQSVGAGPLLGVHLQIAASPSNAFLTNSNSTDSSSILSGESKVFSISYQISEAAGTSFTVTLVPASVGRESVTLAAQSRTILFNVVPAIGVALNGAHSTYDVSTSTK